MLRHLRDVAKRTEVWGLDISAPHIGWLKTHLTPPFQFAVTTTLPHLPFPDAYFGLIYCGSVFTHIDDFVESWMLEVRRVLAPGAYLYCTFHDEHTRASLLAKPEQNLARHLRHHGHPLMDPAAKLPDIVILGTNADSNVFYHSRYLRAMIGPLFEIVAVVPEAYGYQTGWVLRKRPAA
jgi:SAM-dependent methyltransferase